jgi:DNA-directed RNA polymerase subunit H (RpoH/RPB5)
MIPFYQEKTSMNTRALETIRTMLEYRGLSTTEARPVTVPRNTFEASTVYTVGDTLVVFTQKARTLLERDIFKIIEDVKTLGRIKNPLIVVTLVPPSENVLKVMKSYAGDRVQFFHIRQLQFDITKHRMAMPHRILKESERTELFDRYRIKSPKEQLPWIDSQDAMAKWIGAIPGDILEVTRHSDVGGKTLHWRYCVEDVNIA